MISADPLDILPALGHHGSRSEYHLRDLIEGGQIDEPKLSN